MKGDTSKSFSWRKPISKMKLNSNNKCFICLQNISLPITALEHDGSDAQLFSCHNYFNLLQINPGKLAQDVASFANQLPEDNLKALDLQVELCDSCGSLNLRLSDLILKLDTIKLQINYCLEEISKKLDTQEVSLPSLQQFLSFFDKLRKEVSNKCSSFRLGPVAKIEIPVNETCNKILAADNHSINLVKNNKNQISRPLKSKSGPGGVCNICGKRFRSLAQHKAVVHFNERRFKCEKCNLNFKKSSHLTTHNDTTHLGKTFICPNCNKKCHDRWKYKIHLSNCNQATTEVINASHHKKYAEAIATPKIEQEISYHSDENDHFEDDTEANPLPNDFETSDYEASTHDVSGSNFHNANIKLEDEVGSDSEDPLFTPDDMDNNTNPYVLDDEPPLLENEVNMVPNKLSPTKIKKKTGKKKNQKRELCNICNKTFRQLSNHVKVVHQNWKPYSCKFCEETFKKSSHLTYHNDKYHLGKTFICPKCNKNCRDRWKYQKHILNCDHVTTEVINAEDPTKCAEASATSNVEEEINFENETEVDDFSNVCGTPVREKSTQSKSSQSKPSKKKHKKQERELCLICNKTFLQLSNHVKVVHQDKRPFSCKVCNKDFKKSSHLTQHNDRFHLRKSFSCIRCKRKCLNRWLYRKHMLQCAKVKVKLDNERNLKANDNMVEMENMEEIPLRLCNFCGESFINLPQHLEKVHLQVYKFTCDQCDKKFKKSSHLTDHMDRHHFGKTFDCPTCKKKLPNRWKYKTHVEKCGKIVDPDRNNEPKDSIHSSKSATVEEEPAFCAECNKSFKNKNGLRVHLKTSLNHTNFAGFQCEFCEKSLASNHSLKNHQITVHYKELGVQPFTCNFCDQILGSKRSLDAHIRIIHTKDTTLKCEPCNLAFVYKHLYERHIMIVHENKNLGIQCSQCPKMLSNLHNLKVHMRVHSGEKPFECKYCKKRFADHPTFKRHLETHGDQLYNCKVCNRKFKVWHTYR